MNLDPVTLAFEAINFLVLLWLLRRFAFEPVRALLIRRREEIEAGKREVATAKAEITAERTALEIRIAEHERSRDDLMGQARVAARLEAEAMLDRARNEVSQLELEAAAALNKLERRTVAGARTRVVQLAAEAAGRIVSEAAGSTLDTALARRAAQALLASKHDDAARGTAGGMRVEVSPTADIAAIRALLTRELALPTSAATAMEFRTRDDVIAGVRITSGDLLVDATAAQALTSWMSAIGDVDDTGSGALSEGTTPAQAGAR